jgi:hypothetical protein
MFASSVIEADVVPSAASDPLELIPAPEEDASVKDQEIDSDNASTPPNHVFLKLREVNMMYHDIKVILLLPACPRKL